MGYKKGVSGNPKGRPVENRALTEILRHAGNKKVQAPDGEVTGKKLLASMVWEVATTGKLTFPDGTEIKVELNEWRELVKWLYTHIDGPPKTSMELTGANGGPLELKTNVRINLPDNGRNDR